MYRLYLDDDRPCRGGDPFDHTKDLETFHRWFTGEFSNYEQFKQWAYDKKKGKADERFSFIHVHHRFAPIEVQGTDAQGYHVQQRMAATGKMFRERVYLVDAPETDRAIRLRIYTIKDAEEW